MVYNMTIMVYSNTHSWYMLTVTCVAAMTALWWSNSESTASTFRPVFGVWMISSLVVPLPSPRVLRVYANSFSNRPPSVKIQTMNFFRIRSGRVLFLELRPSVKIQIMNFLVFDPKKRLFLQHPPSVQIQTNSYNSNERCFWSDKKTYFHSCFISL